MIQNWHLMAYKSLSDIIDVIGKSVEVIEVLKPIYNFKACSIFLSPRFFEFVRINESY